MGRNVAERLLLVLSIAFVALGVAVPFVLGETPSLRFAISEKVMTGINTNDGRAALSIWSQQMLDQMDLNTAVKRDLLVPSEALLASIRAGTLDLFCLTVEEYRRVAQLVDTTQIITDHQGGVELLLVVREGVGITGLGGLRGKSLMIPETPHSYLAEAWLTVLLLRENLEVPPVFLGRMTRTSKNSQAVLPVFFGQADACVISRPALTTMIELNPQLSRKLKILVVSPRIVNAFFTCRRDYPAHLKKRIFDRLVNLETSTSSRQVLTLFQSPGFAIHDAASLRTTTSLLDEYQTRTAAQPGRKP